MAKRKLVAKRSVKSSASKPGTALAVRSSNPLDLIPDDFRSGLVRRKDNRDALMEWLRKALVEGVDFGRLHIAGKNRCTLKAHGREKECTDPDHFSKPSMFKPGSEKVCGMLGLTPTFPTLKDYEAAAISGAAINNIVVRCDLMNDAGKVVASGVGARSVQSDYGDLNKALKMALKSSQIDATLRCAGLSEVFTAEFDETYASYGPAQPEEGDKKTGTDALRSKMGLVDTPPGIVDGLVKKISLASDVKGLKALKPEAEKVVGVGADLVVAEYNKRFRELKGEAHA